MSGESTNTKVGLEVLSNISRDDGDRFDTNVGVLDRVYVNKSIYRTAICSLLTYGSEAWHMDERTTAMINGAYPHYTPVCSIGDDSFINDTGCWRTASKLVALCVILVPALRGYVCL